MNTASAAHPPVRLILLILCSIATVGLPAHSSRAGQPLYPDLRTAPPAGLRLEPRRFSDGLTHYLLRFDNLIGNWGGRLEIVANFASSRDLYQNVYDSYTGGNLVIHQRVSSDLLYHPTHNHFHFQDFASYQLLKKDTKGIYRLTSRRGSKTSFCIVDTVKVAAIGPGTSLYTTCDNRRQGLSAGWGDVYMAGLPEQWIDLGTSRPADGDYAILSTADPHNVLLEANDANNSATTFFSIRNGGIVIGEQAPTCDTTPRSGPVGTTVHLFCTRLTVDDTVDVRWGGLSTAVLATATVDAQGEILIPVTVPPATLGNHYFFVTSGTSGLSTLALFTVTPGLTLSPDSGTTGTSLSLTLTGFSSGESITVRYVIEGTTSVTLGTLIADYRGSASGNGVVPPSVLGPHRIQATGVTSRATAQAVYNVIPSIRLIPSSGAPGATVSPSLRGFQRYEYVTIELANSGQDLKRVRVSSTGSANATATTRVCHSAHAAAWRACDPCDRPEEWRGGYHHSDGVAGHDIAPERCLTTASAVAKSGDARHHNDFARARAIPNGRHGARA
ncbi:MAG: hypothetical protein KatS3mg059_1518 [Thermomicrobiales bacterium]|nr:MAG: hypothetical protein KatS3mg059_1518 [Thermomicrobiales bacterium]